MLMVRVVVTCGRHQAPDAECDMGEHEFRYGLFPHWHGPHHHHGQVGTRNLEPGG